MTLNPAVQVVLSGTLSFGVPLVIALWELRSLRRHRRGGGNWPRPAPEPTPRPSLGGLKPLPPCLIPNEHWRAPARRVTELV
jgi:hypothetical protein